MGITKYTFMTLKNDIKNSLFYIIAMVISIAVIFNIFNVIFNEEVVPVKGGNYQSMFILGLDILVVATLFMLFANSYYLADKYKEFGVITISGRSVFEIAEIIMLRNFIITILGMIMGSFLGILIAPIINGKVYEISNIINGDLYHISTNGVVMTSMIMVSQFMMVLLVNTGSIYRKKIKDLMISEKQAFLPDNRTLKFPGKYYLAIFLLPFLFLLVPMNMKDKMVLLQIVVLISSYGTQGVVRYSIPNLIYKMRTRDLVVEKKKLIILSNLYTSLQKSTSLIVTLIISIVVILNVACGYEKGTVMNLMGISCYVVVVIIMSFTIVYKFLVEAAKRKKNFKQLYLLGYTRADIKRIIKSEVICFYGIIIGIALSHTSLMIVTSALGGAIGKVTAIYLLALYVGTFSITAIISYFIYKKRAL